MVWVKSIAYYANLRERRFPFGNKPSLVVLLAFLVVGCSDDKNPRSSGDSEGAVNEGPVKKLAGKKRSGSEPAKESTSNEPAANSENPDVPQGRALPALGIVVSPSAISKISGPVSCSYNFASETLPPGAQVQYAWKIGDSVAGDWATSAVELDAGSLHQGVALSCGVRVAQGAAVVTDETWSEPILVGNATPALAESVALAMTDGMFHCSANVQSQDADGQAVSAQYRWRANGELVDETFADALAVGSFVRGTQVQCEVAASDGETASEYVSSGVIERPNLPPSAPASVVLTLTSQLRCVASGSTDPDSDTVAYGFQWLKNGAVVPAETAATYGGIRTKGDTFVCKARASDAVVASDWVSSDSLVIPNAAPSGPTSVTLSPIIAYRSSTLTCSPTGASDRDGDALLTSISWFRNGTLLTGVTGSTLTSLNFAKTDQIRCSATVSDGLINSAAVMSSTVTVLNTPPSAVASVAVLPVPVYANATAPSCSRGSATDQDGDSLNYEFAWRRNGIVVQNFSANPAYGAGPVAKNDVLACASRAVDTSLAVGPSAWSPNVTVQNSAPGIPTEVSLSPLSISVAAVPTCSASGATDSDNDVVAYSYRWKRNGIIDVTATTESFSGPFAKLDTLQCESRSFDGFSYSAWNSSATVTVANSDPSAPAVTTLGPEPAYESTDLTCSAAGSSDQDGDSLEYRYKWKRNGSYLSSEVGNALTGEGFSRGDVIECESVAWDGTVESGTTASGAVIVQNSLPTALASVTVSPATLRASDSSVSCVFSGASDADGDALVYEFSWSLNNTVVQPFSSEQAYMGPTLAKNDTLACAARAMDILSAIGPATSSAFVTVQNTAPIEPSAVTLSPGVAFKSSTLTCSVTGASDADGDSLSNIYLWKNNGTIISGATGATLNGSLFSKLDIISCEAGASDGSLLSPMVASNAVLIGNSPPSSPAAAILEPLSIAADTGAIDCNADIATDIDGDDLTYEFSFRQNGSSIRDWDAAANFDSALFQKGASLSCGVRAVDSDLEVGVALWSSALVVQNSRPTAPLSVILSPALPVVSNTLTCAVSGSTDADGDTITISRRWIKNGTLISGQTASTLAPGQFVAGDNIVCAASASDGELDSDFVSSGDVVINAGPSITIAGTTPSSPSTSRNISLLGTVSAATTVNIFDNSTCAGSPRTSVAAFEFASSGGALTLAVSEVYVVLSARALDDQGNFSACASGVSYFRQPERILDFADSSVALAALTSNPGIGVELAGKLVFAATHPTTGAELWVTDGTPDGTSLLRDINPSGNSSPANLRVVGSLAYFSADNGVNGIELWATDGTSAGTYLVRDIRTGGNSSSPAFFQDFGGILLFAADDGVNGAELWTSDGTSVGTQLVRNINSGSTASSPRNFANLGSFSYFQATDATNGAELWRTDGTSAGTTLVANIRASAASSSPAQLVAVGAYVVFVADDGVNGAELWSTDGASTTMLRNINGTSASSSVTGLFVHQNEAYFFANDVTNGAELWKSNGTAAGTILVKDIRVGTSSSQPTTIAMATLGASLLFSANNGTSGTELFVTDGTSAGTVLLKDITAGSSSSSPVNFLTIGTKVYFQAAGELYVTDGTPSGTALVKDIRVGTSASSPRNFAKFGNSAVFVADNGVVGSELWVSDSTSAGTVLLKDINSSRSLTILSRFVTTTNDLVYFVADDGIAGPELWASDGTSVGTYLVRDINAGAAGSSITNLTAIGDLVYFSATTAASGAEPWRSNGTSGGTFMLAELGTTTTSSSPSLFTEFQGHAYFVASSSAAGSEVYSSDGNAATLLKDIRSGTTGSTPTGLAAVGSNLYFQANDGTNGAELWASNGTDAGTTMVLNINSGSASSSPVSIVGVNGKAVFAATTAANGQELWTSDGTAGGTQLVRDIRAGTSSSSIVNIVSNGTRIYFSATNGSSGSELWTSDGTLAGTVQVRDILSGGGSSSPAQIRFVGSRVFFAATGTTNQGQELWLSDGTSAGTVLVRDINAGIPFGSSITGATEVSGRLFFTANDGVNGQDLWVSDGTSAGTHRVFDHLSQVGVPTSIALSNGFAYFGGASQGSSVNSLFRF